MNIEKMYSLIFILNINYIIGKLNILEGKFLIYYKVKILLIKCY